MLLIVEPPRAIKREDWVYKARFPGHFISSSSRGGCTARLQDSYNMSRNLRKSKRPDYAALNSGKMLKSRRDSSSDESDTDTIGEKELLDQSLDFLDINPAEEEDDFLEDGELQESDESDECVPTATDKYSKLIKKYTKEGNVEKLKEILNKKRERCKKLKTEVETERKKEKEKEMKMVLAELNKVNKAEYSLEKSLSSSRSSTPCNSPRRRNRNKATNKKENGLRTKKPTVASKVCKKTSLDKEKSEYKDILTTLMGIKQGKTEVYSELVEKAMDATDNIIKIKESRTHESKNSQDESDANSNYSDSCNERECDNNSEVGNKDQVLKLLQELRHEVKDNNQISVESLTKVLKTIGAEDNEKIGAHAHKSKVNIDMMTEADNAIGKCEHTGGKFKNNQNKENKDSSDKKKLVSGRCSKPDDIDIKRVVKYAHEKLDSRHVAPSDKNFDKLTFTWLIAGEIELAMQEEIDMTERMARLSIVKTICYHRSYLSEGELKDGYDQILKKIEQGQRNWSDNLGEELHRYLDYRANLLLREKIQKEKQESYKANKWEVKSTIGTRSEKTATEQEKIIFCAAYNKGHCTFTDHHEGRFSNKSVTKWHICSKCYKNGERKSHREVDDECPTKA